MNFLAQFGSWCGGPGWNGWSGMGGWHAGMPFHFGWVIQLLVLGTLIYFAVRLVRKPAASTGTGRVDNPEDILKRRYAAGEIDKQTYRDMHEDLQRKQ